MAEIAVNLVIDKLIPLLRDEVNLSRGMHNKLESMKEQLQLIRAYLKDADEKGKTSDLVREWVTQMRQVSLRIEDVIDEYLFEADNKLQLQDKCWVTGICKIFYLLRSIMPRHKIASQIDEIREAIERLNEAKETFGFNPSAPEPSTDISPLHYLRRGALFSEDDQLVGIDDTKQLLSSWLLENGNRTVISVVGEGGLGKTTIVHKVFRKQENEKYFDCFAWITVSRSLKGDNLLKNLLQEFYEKTGDENAVNEVNKMNSNTLLTKLREYLQQKRYLIVFDDVWEISFLGDVELALPKDKGRIIITTRDRRVAEFCGSYGPIHVHDIGPLNQYDAWKLFCFKAFPEGCPKNLEALSEEFVKKCNGMPLAIVAIAGLLSTKNKNVLEWQRVYDSLRSKLSSDPHLTSVHQVLSESYQDLNYRLKSCLLYFGLFPEGSLIVGWRIIDLWITEGFVENKEDDGQTLVEVAEEYLAELISRSLVKAVEVLPYGKVFSFRVHDLLHGFILKKCEELNFCQVKKNEGFKLHHWTRRLSMETSIVDSTMKTSVANYGLVRSCFLFNIDELTSLESLFSCFKLLVRLDCEGVPLDYLPEAVGNLLQLKYLNLSRTNIKVIPKFIGKLHNLETLNLRCTYVSELPSEINKLIKLRNLLADMGSFKGFTGVKLKEGFGNLSSLQKLSMVEANDDADVIMKELEKLKQMKTLGICKVHKESGLSLCSAIGSMTYLQVLAIGAAEGEVLDLDSLSVPPQNLRTLFLFGLLEKLPDWISKLRNLVSLYLDYSELTEDPLPFLKDLSALLELQLRRSYVGDALCFREGWFMSLKALSIRAHSLQTLEIDEGAMPHLQRFILDDRPGTMLVPSHIQPLIQYLDKQYHYLVCPRLSENNLSTVMRGR